MQKKLFIGIDLNDDRAMVSLLPEGMADVETISTEPGAERYQIPTSVFVSDRGSYYYGEEAIKRQERTDGSFFSDLYREAMIPDNVIYQNMFIRFLSRLIRFKDRYDSDNPESYLAIAVPEITKEVVDFFSLVREKLGFQKDHFRIMDYGESFFAHTYHQDPSVWVHDVALFDFTSNKIVSYVLHSDRSGNIKRVVSSRKEWVVPAYIMENYAGRDEFFANIVRESFMKRVISGVYFIGEGFDGDWLKESLRVIGPNKRVFKGNNLYTIGACLAAFRNEITQGWNFYYDCSYKLQGEISLKVLKDGEPAFIRLVQLGENWFAPTNKYYLMYDGDPQLEFWVRRRDRVNPRLVTFTLDYLPERDKKSIRLSVQAIPICANEVIVKLEDDGFGELFLSSGRIWNFRVSV